MRTTRTRNAFAAVLAGALMAVASPAIAHAQSVPSNDWTPVALSTLRTAAAPSYGIGNYKSGKFLQPSGGSTANGAKIVQQPGNQLLSAQHWIPVADGNYYSFENGGSGRNLGIDGASTAAGAAAIQANGSGDLNQDWLLAYSSAYPANTFALKNRKSGLCLGISSASTANGAQAAQFRCDGSANQGWGLFNQ
ncbi:RICIN domain-containing protein [Streptomyces sp. NPDC002668]|uniref:RICIN domain-containing protein n=1 Tax=Streptomyces sp. NPDC002668 TaxID=3154422 RepID=UPI003321EDF4